ncbi:MAG TPA: hypothetical protein VMS88_02060 [Terriglobales bacterium]|nr:hypothetical protein [Terriglobales bacterium]
MHSASAAFSPASRSGAFLTFALLAVLATSLTSGFLMDDWFHLERAGRPLTSGALDFTLSTREQGIRLWVHPAPVQVRFFRPVTSLSFWLDRRLWGERAWGFHLTNIAVHLLAVWALAALARAVGLSRPIACFVAVAWGLSAASVPAVQWISGRTEILCGAASLGATIAFLRWDRTRRWPDLAVSVLLAAAAAMSKETGVAVAPFAWCLAQVRRVNDPRAARRPLIGGLAALAVPAAAAIMVRVLLLHLRAPEAPYSEPVRSVGDAAWLALEPAWALLATLASLPVSHLGPFAFLRTHPALAASVLVMGAPFVVALFRSAGAGASVPLLAAFVVALAPSLPVVMTTLYFYLPATALVIWIGIASEKRARQRAWLVLWLAVGTLAHVSIAALTTLASRQELEHLEHLEGLIARRHYARLIVIDAPFWTYGMPAAMRARGHGAFEETRFVNFQPSAWPRSPSSLDWSGARSLRVRLRTREGLLDSPIERFLAFGGTAQGAQGGTADDPVSVEAEAPGIHPHELIVRFRDDEALRRSCIVRFIGSGLDSVPPPGGQNRPQGPVP